MTSGWEDGKKVAPPDRADSAKWLECRVPGRRAATGSKSSQFAKGGFSFPEGLLDLWQ